MALNILFCMNTISSTKGKINFEITFLRYSPEKMILIPIGEIYAQVAKSATSYYSLIVLPLTNFTLHPLTCCVIDKEIKELV